MKYSTQNKQNLEQVQIPQQDQNQFTESSQFLQYLLQSQIDQYAAEKAANQPQIQNLQQDQQDNYYILENNFATEQNKNIDMLKIIPQQADKDFYLPVDLQAQNQTQQQQILYLLDQVNLIQPNASETICAESQNQVTAQQQNRYNLIQNQLSLKFSKHISGILKSQKITPGGLNSLKSRSKQIKKNKLMKAVNKQIPTLKKAKSLIVSIPFKKLNGEKVITVDNSNINEDNVNNGSYQKVNENSKSCIISLDLNKTQNAVKVCLEFSEPQFDEQGHQSTRGSSFILNKAI